jgi:hypothetical protein
MKKILWLASFVFLSVVLYQCTRKAQTPVETVKYPNEGSELALLMREMEAEAVSMREAIKNGKELKDLRAQFEKIFTAKSTEASMQTPAFQVMAKNYLKSLNKVYEAPQAERMAQYNIMINDCMNCHKAQCPGPLVRIQKLSNK